MNPKNEPISKKLYIVITSALIVIGILTIFFTPELPKDYQSVVGSTVGSIVGTALAFLGAVWLWAKEQRKLAADEADRERKLIAENEERKEKDRIAQDQSRDKELLREAHAAIGSLIALNYRDQGLDTASINLQKRILEMKLSQNTALIHDETLREECSFISEIASDGSNLKYYLTDASNLLYIARDWYLRLITLEPSAPVVAVRPISYPSLKEAMDELDEYREQSIQAQIEREEEERTKKKEAANEAKNN